MVEEEEPGVFEEEPLLVGGTEESLPELLPPVGSVSPPVTKSSFRSGPSGVETEEPPEGAELLPESGVVLELVELPVLPELPELPELVELLVLPELPVLPEL